MHVHDLLQGMVLSFLICRVSCFNVYASKLETVYVDVCCDDIDLILFCFCSVHSLLCLHYCSLTFVVTLFY